MESIQASHKNSSSRETSKDRIPISLLEYARCYCCSDHINSEGILVCNSCLRIFIRSILLSGNGGLAEVQNHNGEIPRAKDNPGADSYYRKRDQSDKEEDQDYNIDSRKALWMVDNADISINSNDSNESIWESSTLPDSVCIDYTSNLPNTLFRSSLLPHKANL